MREFRDDQGRPWTIALTTNAALRVRSLVTTSATVDEAQEDGTTSHVTKAVPVDIIDLAQINQTLAMIKGQFATLAEVLWALVKPQAEAKNIDRESFLDGMRGEAFESAGSALIDELVDFFPKRLRPMVGLMASKLDELQAQTVKVAEQQLAGINVAELSGTASGRLQESLESTPESGPIDNSQPLVTAA